MLLLTAFAGLALILAAIGTYGVLAYLVSQGSRELGIRIALGAGPGAIVGLVLRQGMTLAIAGILVGLAGAFGLARLMSSLLFGIQPTDAPTFAAVALLLGAVALVAGLIPARRASRIDPIANLRTE